MSNALFQKCVLLSTLLPRQSTLLTSYSEYKNRAVGKNDWRRVRVFFRSYHDAVGLSDGPQVDLLVVAAGDEDAPGLVAQRQAVDVGRVRHELL